uniref:Proline-rich protein PRCC n=1 Tax=Glossina brevipalpis TaxID=37001 RepID=A0A1A9X2W9_9MUSC
MSLVAYDTSSSEECENDDEFPEVIPAKGKTINEKPANDGKTKKSFSLMLPMPKKDIEEQNYSPCTATKLAFNKLPPAKTANMEGNQIAEIDDEFLHRKAELLSNSSVKRPLPATPKRGPVKILIPSMKDFDDVTGELTGTAKIRQQALLSDTKRSGLLSILPKPKTEKSFTKSSENKAVTSSEAHKSVAPVFIPDTITKKRPACNTENIDGIGVRSLQTTIKPRKVCSDNEASDDEISNGSVITDFFSLERNEKLPEVCANEIKAMVAKRATEIVESAKKHCKSETLANTKELEEQRNELGLQHISTDSEKLDPMEAIKALAGSSIKRKRYELEDIQMTDLTSEQVLPNRDEWMRSALASSTIYQSTGVLVDEEPASGTRRKHQITYLAHKAKANEAELQAMWAANRQTRRATQNKYGF